MTNVFVIAPRAFGTRVIFDASESTGDEDKPLNYRWQEGKNVFANSVITTNFLSVGSHAIILTVSNDSGSDSDTAVVTVITPSESVQILIGMVERSNLPPKMRQTLASMLRAAATAFERGRPSAGLHQLAGFQTVVQLQLARNNPALAAQLTDSTQTIIEALAHP